VVTVLLGVVVGVVANVVVDGLTPALTAAAEVCVCVLPTIATAATAVTPSVAAHDRSGFICTSTWCQMQIRMP
jgi:hypothetical protein